ncbi:MAG: leucine-rich repeat domain-containing protein [Bacteroidales bacterium]|nr:leucine-rich repeat domain-containing protein [Bacteroidales bacterium]
MTKHLRILLALIMLMAVSVAKASTLYYVVDNIRYAVNTDDNTAMVVAYSAYKDMTEITIPATITEDGVTYRVTYIDSKCFEDCSSLASVNLPDGIHFKGGAFYRCTGLKSIIIPASVMSLPSDCFAGCTNLTSIIIPNSVTSLGGSCFAGCTNLTNITIPNTVTGLGQYCFANCI